jgi:transcriptional regulator
MRRQLRGIVAFEMAVERIETKFKMSQNRSAADIHGVVDALSASEREDDRGTATMMRALNRSK